MLTRRHMLATGAAMPLAAGLAPAARAVPLDVSAEDCQVAIGRVLLDPEPEVRDLNARVPWLDATDAEESSAVFATPERDRVVLLGPVDERPDFDHVAGVGLVEHRCQFPVGADWFVPDSSNHDRFAGQPTGVC